MATAAQAAPALVGGRYRLIERIGAGATAVVYRAADEHAGGVVAVKALDPHLTSDRIGLERFRRELHVARAVGHPQVVAAYDLVVEEPHVYLVMEHVPGENLKHALLRVGRFELDAALDALTQMLDVLAACHAREVVHRDLKPQNVIRMPDGVLKLLDFGIARVQALGDLTQTGTTLGSPEYMAPELFLANAWDPRTDLYALGVIVYELLAGRLPFRGDSLPVLARQHLQEPPPPLRQSCPDLPAWVDDLVGRLLAKSAHERYQTAEEVRADVERRRVVAREVPRLPTRECLRCGVATLDVLPWCTACGHEPGRERRGWLQPSFDLWATERTDREALRGWMTRVLGARPATPPAGPLIGALDRTTAELVRQSARRHRVALAVRRHPRLVALRRVAALAGAGWLAVFSVNLFAMAWMLAHADGWVVRRGMSADAGVVLTAVQAAVLLGLGLFLVRVAARQPRRARLGGAALAGTAVAAEHEWLRGLVAVERGAQGTRLAGVVSRMVERYLLLLRHGPGGEPAVEQRVRDVLACAGELVGVAASLERTIGTAELSRRASAYTVLADVLALEPEPGRRAALEGRQQALRRALEAGFETEDVVARLTRSLVRLQAMLDGVVGRLLVLRGPVENADELSACVREARAELAAARAVRAALDGRSGPPA